VETKILAGSPQRVAELKSTLGSDTGKLLDRSLSLARSRVCVRALALSLSDTQMCARTHTFTSQTAREAQHGAQGTGEKISENQHGKAGRTATNFHSTTWQGLEAATGVTAPDTAKPATPALEADGERAVRSAWGLAVASLVLVLGCTV
jgi:hypothetical protein